MAHKGFSFHPFAKHVILKLDVFPWSGYRELENYSFVFSIFPGKEDDEKCYVKIEIVHDSDLVAMNEGVIQADKFIFKEGSLVINDFIEVVQEKTRFHTQYVAILRNQLKFINDNKYVGTRNVLLFTNNLDGEGLIDGYSAFYANEFESSVNWQKAQFDHQLFIKVYRYLETSTEKVYFKKLLKEKEEILKVKWELYMDTIIEKY
ncbi:hypothetical protein [Paenibacillus sp. FSL H8-0079]|uniref:hypothetical protein n=1 Tax=Paenibacillus sp. FSL H8-0079 TaxID=2921375 RepID=UPI0030EE316D